jgi:hypothetical protein
VSDIPGYTEAVQAAAKAEFIADRHTAAEWDYPQNDTLREAYRRAAEVAVATAVPHIERAIRDRIADELEARAEAGKPLGSHHAVGVFDALLAAAVVARGGEATE